jgi:hypothetical protein
MQLRIKTGSRKKPAALDLITVGLWRDAVAVF